MKLSYILIAILLVASAIATSTVNKPMNAKLPPDAATNEALYEAAHGCLAVYFIIVFWPIENQLNILR